jgi:hypothetical protein
MIMFRRVLGVGSVALVLLIGAVGAPSVAYGAVDQGAREPRLTQADQQGAGTVGRIAGKIAREEPEHFVGSAVGPDADSVPRIYIKGKASAFVHDLVAGAGIPIEIIDGQPYSFTELEDRPMQVQQALLKLGLTDFSVATDITGAGRIPVRIRLTAATPSDAAILLAVPADLRDDVVITLDSKGDWDPDQAGASPSPLASADPCPSPEIPGPSTSPGVSMPSALPSGAVPSSDPCASPGVAVAPTAAWGPMAVVQDTLHDSLDQGFGPGVLSIGEACVTFKGEGWETTLVFRDWQAVWDAAAGTIALQDPSGERLVLKTGDTLILGGYAPWDGDTTGEPPAPPWLVQPGPDCPSDLWLVHSARPVG